MTLGSCYLSFPERSTVRCHPSCRGCVAFECARFLPAAATFGAAGRTLRCLSKVKNKIKKERVVCFPSLLSSNLSSTCVSKFKSPTRIATAAESTQPQCVYVHMQHAPSAVRVPSALVPLHSTIIPIILPILYTCIYIYISIHTYTHWYILYMHIYASMSLSVLHSESRGLWKVLQVSWP